MGGKGNKGLGRRSGRERGGELGMKTEEEEKEKEEAIWEVGMNERVQAWASWRVEGAGIEEELLRLEVAWETGTLLVLLLSLW